MSLLVYHFIRKWRWYEGKIKKGKGKWIAIYYVATKRKIKGVEPTFEIC